MAQFTPNTLRDSEIHNLHTPMRDGEQPHQDFSQTLKSGLPGDVSP